MFQEDGNACLDFIKNYSNDNDNDNDNGNDNDTFFLQNISTFSNFIKYIDSKLVNNSKFEFLKLSFGKIKDIIRENRRKKIKREKDDDDYQNQHPRRNSFVNFQYPKSHPKSHPKSSSKSPPKTVTNIIEQKDIRITMKDVTTILDDIYNSEESQQSTTLDILAIYLKGQKILYIEAKTHCEQHLNSLMLPAIFISSLCTLLSVVLHLWRFKTPILNQRKKIQKYKINSQGLPPCLWFYFILAFAW